MSVEIHSLRFPGALLERGFWLYVWEIRTAKGEVILYVGRTGDEASANAQSPFNRVSQHLGNNKHSNALRRQLERRGIDSARCVSFEMIAYGPILPAAANWEEHKPFRDKTAAIEKKLRDALAGAGYVVLNEIDCKRELDLDLWEQVRAAYAQHFPNLQTRAAAGAAIGDR